MAQLRHRLLGRLHDRGRRAVADAEGLLAQRGRASTRAPRLPALPRARTGPVTRLRPGPALGLRSILSRRRPQGGEHLTPAARGVGARVLGQVPHHREGSHRAATRQRPPRHGAQLLGLIDDDVPVGPRPIRPGPLGQSQSRTALGDPVGQHLGTDHPAAQLLGLDCLGRVGHQVLAAAGLQSGAPGLGVLAGAQQLGQLVNERDVRRTQGAPGLTVQQRALLLAQGWRHLLQEGGPAPQPLQQPLGRRRHPAQVDLPAGVTGGTDVLPDPGARVGVRGVLVRGRRVLVGQALQQPDHEGLAGQVVGLAAPTGPGGRLTHVVGLQGQAHTLDLDLAGSIRDALQAPHRPLQGLDPQGATFELGDTGILLRRGPHPGNQVANRRGDHPRLTQGGQHLLHIAQEGARRPHQEHAGTLQALALGVEQVGHPVQCHGRLTRARAALDHEHTPARGGDDPVLLGLNRGHDVTHTAVTGAGHRGDERPLALQVPSGHGRPGRVGRALAGLQGGQVQDLVLHPEHLTGPGVDVPPTHQPHGLGGRGLIEGPGQRGAPVQDHLTVLGVLQANTTHIVAPAPVSDGGGTAHAPAGAGG